ncbi:MAG TPA: sialidase family protein, partial [Chitinophagaceae bacterium]|nr:sialidase family protein [Chitinophagaceae bacterium]
MKKILIPILLLLFTAISLPFISKLLFHKNILVSVIHSQENEMLSGNENERTDGPEKLMRHEFLMTRDPALNIVPTERIIEAKRKMDEMELATARGAGSNNTLALTWQERGPNNIGGRTRALLIDKSDASGNTVFAAGVGGGLWKTINFKTTATWAAINDFFSNIAITCIKQSPTDPLVMYFGTGEGFANADAINGLGIWKSTNGGVSWAQLSSTTNITYVNDLEFDNNGYIYAATRSTVAGLRGIIRSTDAGVNWTQVLTDPIPTATSRGA